MKKETVLLVLIIVLGFFLRFWVLSSVPPELNRDEVSVGFNAYSLLKTSRDEHGQGPWPIIFRAFGDYKIPGYIYLVIPLIKLFGLNAFSVRLPSAFFGGCTIIIVYQLVKELWPKKENLALLTALILTISPFHLHYSRQQFEATVALFFSLTGIWLLLKARTNIKWIFVTLPFFTAAFFIYNASLFIIPILVCWSVFVFRHNFLINRQNQIKIGSFMIILFVILSSYWFLVQEGNRGRANTTFFNQVSIKEDIDLNIHYLVNKQIPLGLIRLFNNKPLYWLSEFGKNYLAAFNPKFIFFTGDNNPWHGLGFLNYGNILVIFLPFIIFGLKKLSQNIGEKEFLWLFGYLLITPFANGLTIDSPILTRLLDFHVILVLLAAIGLEDIFVRFPGSKFFQIKNYLIMVLITLFCINYFTTYFIVSPQFVSKNDFWLSGIKEVALIVKKEESKYDFIFLDSKTEVGYIFLAFYLPFNPADFQKQAIWQLDGFEKVKSYQKYIFNKDANKLNKVDELKAELGSGKKVLLIEKIPYHGSVQKLDYRTFIYNSLGEPIWQFTSVVT